MTVRIHSFKRTLYAFALGLLLHAAGPLAQGFSHGTVNGPAEQKATFQRAGLEVEIAFPLGDGLHATVEADDVIHPSVVGLIEATRPSAVSRLVVPVHVDALNRMAARARPHINQERGEAVPPTVAHRNPTPAVVLEGSRIWVEASRFGGAPRPIFARVGVAVLRGLLSADLIVEAPATSRVPIAKVAANHGHLGSADTPTAPSGQFAESRFSWRSTKDG